MTFKPQKIKIQCTQIGIHIAIDVAGDNTSNSYDRFSAHTSLFCNGVQ